MTYNPDDDPKFQKILGDILAIRQSVVDKQGVVIEHTPPDDPFAPKSFDDYVGQERAKDIVKIIIDAAKLEKRPLPNLLIFGPYGLGKTTLAKLIMKRFGVPAKLVDASAVSRNPTLSEFTIIDEIHNLSAEIADQLNTYLDDGSVHIIGCTTNPGALPAAFRSRLRQISLEDYTQDNIETILRNSLHRKKIEWRGKSVVEIAQRSRFNPRGALQILAFALELTTTSGYDTLTIHTVRKAFEKLDIDDRGLTPLDKKYLSILSSAKPMGLTQICAMLGTDSDTVQFDIEPFLLRLGLIERTARGRQLMEHIEEKDLIDMLLNSVSFVKK